MTEEVQEAVEQPKEVDAQALLEALEKAGITDPKVLQGKVEASRQAGNLANQLGDTRAQLDSARQELAELKRMMQENQARPTQRHRDDFDLDNYGEGQPINIQEEVTKGVKRVLTEMQKQQQEAQIKAYRQAQQIVSSIQNDRYYPAVKEIWDAKCQDPTFQMEVNSGRINPINAYKELVIEFQGNLLNQSASVLKNQKGIVPPNMETSGTRGQKQGNLVSETPQEQSIVQQKQKDLLAKVDKGYRATDDEILDTFDDVLNKAFS